MEELVRRRKTTTTKFFQLWSYSEMFLNFFLLPFNNNICMLMFEQYLQNESMLVHSTSNMPVASCHWCDSDWCHGTQMPLAGQPLVYLLQCTVLPSSHGLFPIVQLHVSCMVLLSLQFSSLFLITNLIPWFFCVWEIFTELHFFPPKQSPIICVLSTALLLRIVFSFIRTEPCFWSLAFLYWLVAREWLV